MSTIFAHGGSLLFGFLAAGLGLGYNDLIAAAALGIALWVIFEWRLFDTMRRETWGAESTWNLKSASMIGVIYSGHTLTSLSLMSLSYWPARLALFAEA